MTRTTLSKLARGTQDNTVTPYSYPMNFVVRIRM
jgi:hypothetical protein